MKHFLINFLAISGNSKHFSFFQKKPKKSTPWGAGGSLEFFFTPNLIFCELKPHAKFWNPTITPSGRKVTRRREERRENNAVNSGHFVSVTAHATTRTNVFKSRQQQKYGPSGCMRCNGTKCPLLTALFSILSLFSPPGYFSPRRGYRRVPKFCMGF